MSVRTLLLFSCVHALRLGLEWSLEPEQSRSRILHFLAGAGAEPECQFKKKLGAGVEPESDFKVVFEVVMIVGGRMSHYFCSLEMEYQDM